MKRKPDTIKTFLLLLFFSTLLGCGVFTNQKLKKFERPAKFPETCEWVNDGISYCVKLQSLGQNCKVHKKQKNYICYSAVLWDHTSDAKSCLSHDEFTAVTRHVVGLNHVIDLYENQVDEWNSR